MTKQTEDERKTTATRKTSTTRKTSAKREASKKRIASSSSTSDRGRDIHDRKDGYHDVAKRILAERTMCDAGRAIGAIQCWLLLSTGRLERAPDQVLTYEQCERTSCEVHIVDETRLLAVCRACHQWLHDSYTYGPLVGLLAPVSVEP